MEGKFFCSLLLEALLHIVELEQAGISAQRCVTVSRGSQMRIDVF